MDTKSLIINVATKLFYEKGYVSVGVAEIINATNTSKGSFYHHFPKGKEQLLITCLEKVQMDVMEDMKQKFEEHKTFKEALLAIFDQLIRMFEENGQIEGYTVTSIVSEIGVISETVREVCANLYTHIEQEFTEKKKKRGIPFEQARMKALFITATIEGSIMLSITKKMVEPLRIVSQQISQNIYIEGEDF